MTDKETNVDFKIEKKKKRSKRLLKDFVEPEIDQAEVKRLRKKIKFVFCYERMGFTKDIQRDFRTQIEKIIKSRHKDKKVKEIPEEFELELKYKRKYLVILANRDELLEVDPKMLYDPKKFGWMKHIEDQEYGVVDDY
jgi:hypothetical protein